MRKFAWLLALAMLVAPLEGQSRTSGRSAPGFLTSIKHYIESIRFTTFHVDSLTVSDSASLIIGADIDLTGNYLLDVQNITDRQGTHVWFDAVDDTLLIGNNAKLLDLFDDNGGAIEIVFRPRNDGSSDTAYVWAMSSSFLGVTGETGGKMKVRFIYDFSTTDGQWTSTNTAASTDDWNHLLVVYDADAVSNNPVFYLNADTVGITEDTTPVGTRGSDTGANIVIGSDGVGAYVYDGDISLIRYWNIIPSYDEVKALYSGSALPFKFYGADNTLINDTSQATTQTDAVVIGKKYEWLGGDSLKFLDDNVETLISTTATTFIATEDTVKVYGDNTEADLYQIGAVLEYRGEGINIAEAKWYSSGHDGLHAGMDEAVAVSELPNLYLNSQEPVANDKLFSINKTVSGSRTELVWIDEDGDMDVLDNATIGDVVIDESVGKLAFSGGSSATISTSTAGVGLTLDAADAAAGTANSYVTISGTTPVHGASTPTDIWLDINPTINIPTVATKSHLIDLTYSAPAYATAVTSSTEGIHIVPTTGTSSAGTNTITGITIDPTIGDATTGTHTFVGLDIDAIAGDAQTTTYGVRIGALTGTGATENAIDIATGWDSGIKNVSVTTLGGAANFTTIDTDGSIDFATATAAILTTTAGDINFAPAEGGDVVVSTGDTLVVDDVTLNVSLMPDADQGAFIGVTGTRINLIYADSMFANVFTNSDMTLSESGSDITINADTIKGDVVWSGGLEIAGDLDIDTLVVDEEIQLAATKKMFFDGSGDTYIHERGADTLELVVGGVDMLRLEEGASDQITTAAVAFDFDGAATVSASGNNLLTVTGGTAGVRIDDVLGIDTAPVVNSGIAMGRSVTATNDYDGIDYIETTTLATTKDFAGLKIDPTGVVAHDDGTHGSIAGINIGNFTVTETNSSTITTLAGLYIEDTPQYSGAGGDVTNLFSLFVDAGESRFDGDVNIDGDLDFIGAQSITTTTGALTFNPAENFDVVVAAGDTLVVDDITVNTSIMPDADQGADIGVTGTRMNLIWADTVHANVYDGTDFVLGGSGSDITFNADTLKGEPVYMGDLNITGDLTVTGSASQIAYFESWEIDPSIPGQPSGPPAQSNIDNFTVLLYDFNSDEQVYYTWEVPHNYNSADSVMVHFAFVSTSAVTTVQDTNVVWGVEYKLINMGDDFDFSGGTSTALDTVTWSSGSVNDYMHGDISLTTTGFSDEDAVMMRLYRDADNAADDYGADAGVIKFHIDYKVIK